jgi:hypothetical protein
VRAVLEFPPKGDPPNAKQIGRGCLIASGLFKGVADLIDFFFFPFRPGGLQFVGKICESQIESLCMHKGMLNRVFKLTNITRPVVVHERRDGIVSRTQNAFLHLLIIFRQKMLHE